MDVLTEDPQTAYSFAEDEMEAKAMIPAETEEPMIPAETEETTILVEPAEPLCSIAHRQKVEALFGQGPVVYKVALLFPHQQHSLATAAAAEVVVEEVEVGVEVVTEVVNLVQERGGGRAMIAVKSVGFAIVEIAPVPAAVTHSSSAEHQTPLVEVVVIHTKRTTPDAHHVALVVVRKAGFGARFLQTQVTSKTSVERSAAGSPGNLPLARMHSPDTAAVAHNPVAVTRTLAAVA